ncbi:MAG TPA: glycosyltransferase family 4 protein, partial [Actinomycetota bacterium]|nr:glycosyltransferase family 4 protein [Actinomycetota bacterium]
SPTVAFLKEGPFVQEVAERGVPIIQLSESPRLRQVWGWRRAIEEITQTIHDVECDLLQANGEKMSVLAGRAAKAAGIPSISWLQDSPGAGGIGGRLTQRALSRTPLGKVVVCASWMQEEFEKEVGLRSSVIVSGCEIEGLPDPNDPAVTMIKQQMGWPPDSLVLGHFARLQRWKGTDTFLKASAIVRRKHPQARFLVVGDALFGRETQYADELRNLARELGLDGHVCFTGFRDDALQVMAGTDIVVHCSTKPDPFPTVVLEGMAMAKPVIASRSKGPEESLVDGLTGRLYPPGDAESLAAIMDELISSPVLRSDLGTEAAAAVRNHFTADRMARQFEDMYRSLVKSARAGAL